MVNKANSCTKFISQSVETYNLNCDDLRYAFQLCDLARILLVGRFSLKTGHGLSDMLS